MFLHLLKPLIFTLIIESIVAIIIGIRDIKSLFVLLITNIVTNLTLNIFAYNFVFDISLCFSGNFGINLFLLQKVIEYVLEIIVFIIETLIIYFYVDTKYCIINKLCSNKIIRSVIISLLINSTSYLLYKII